MFLDVFNIQLDIQDKVDREFCFNVATEKIQLFDKKHTSNLKRMHLLFETHVT